MNQTKTLPFTTPYFPLSQLILLLIFLGLSSVLIINSIKQASINSVLLCGIVSVLGLLLCKNTQTSLKDPALKVLGYFWLIKLLVTLFLIFVGWIPMLDPDFLGSGYDPIRYYSQAQDLVDANWSLDIINLNYVGVLYYYGLIFYIFGHNPVIPALINALLTLVACLYLVRTCYEVKGERGGKDWIIAFCLLMPEMLWYDVMTSRETLVAALLLFPMLTFGRYLAGVTSISLSKTLMIVGICILAIAAVRATMLFPLLASIVIMSLLIKPKNKIKYLFAVDIVEKMTAVSSLEANASEADRIWTEHSLIILGFKGNTQELSINL